MATAMYLNNRDEISAAARAAKALGLATSIEDIRSNDRYVSNIVDRLAGMDGDLGVQLENAIVAAVKQVRLRAA